MEYGWEAVKSGALIAAAAIESAWSTMLLGLEKALVSLVKGASGMVGAVDSELGESLMVWARTREVDMLGRNQASRADFNALFNPTTQAAAFGIGTRQYQHDTMGRFLEGTERVMRPGLFSSEDIEKIVRTTYVAIAELERKELHGRADLLRRALDESLQKIERERGLGFNVRRAMIGQDTVASYAGISARRESMLADVEKEFGGRSRLGQGPLDSMTDDVWKVMETIKAAMKSMTDGILGASETVDKATETTKKALAADPVKQLSKDMKNVKTDTEEAATSFRSFGDAASGAFEDAILQARSLGEVVQALWMDIARLTFRQTAGNQIAGLVSSFAGSLFGGGGPTPFVGPTKAMMVANGAAFSGGSVIPFASGGIVNGPVTFPMAGRRLGLMGEAGPEAVMPLKRGADGKLGVAAEGGGKTINFNMTINTPDANSFRKSKRQIASEMRRMAGGI